MVQPRVGLSIFTSSRIFPTTQANQQYGPLDPRSNNGSCTRNREKESIRVLADALIRTEDSIRAFVLCLEWIGSGIRVSQITTCRSFQPYASDE